MRLTWSLTTLFRHPYGLVIGCKTDVAKVVNNVSFAVPETVIDREAAEGCMPRNRGEVPKLTAGNGIVLTTDDSDEVC